MFVVVIATAVACVVAVADSDVIPCVLCLFVCVKEEERCALRFQIAALEVSADTCWASDSSKTSGGLHTYSYIRGLIHHTISSCFYELDGSIQHEPVSGPTVQRKECTTFSVS